MKEISENIWIERHSKENFRANIDFSICGLVSKGCKNSREALKDLKKGIKDYIKDLEGEISIIDNELCPKKLIHQ